MGSDRALALFERDRPKVARAENQEATKCFSSSCAALDPLAGHSGGEQITGSGPPHSAGFALAMSPVVGCAHALKARRSGKDEHSQARPLAQASPLGRPAGPGSVVAAGLTSRSRAVAWAAPNPKNAPA
jgi:hypothetical protein